jgi:hypothetical protein
MVLNLLCIILSIFVLDLVFKGNRKVESGIQLDLLAYTAQTFFTLFSFSIIPNFILFFMLFIYLA